MVVATLCVLSSTLYTSWYVCVCAHEVLLYKVRPRNGILTHPPLHIWENKGQDMGGWATHNYSCSPPPWNWPLQQIPCLLTNFSPTLYKSHSPIGFPKKNRGSNIMCYFLSTSTSLLSSQKKKHDFPKNPRIFSRLGKSNELWWFSKQ